MALVNLGEDYSHTFLNEMTPGDEDIDHWVALSGSQDFVKEFLELGEDSLEFSAAEDQLRNLQNKLNEAELRESELKKDLLAKDKVISNMEDAMDHLKKELLEERAKARDEAEDMAQEMAELRYQLTEMLEEERQLRARTEQVSVHRVEELENQVKQAREEVVAALSRRREAESRAEKEIQELRRALEDSHRQLQDALAVQKVEPIQQECEKCSSYVNEVALLEEKILQLTCKFEEKEKELQERLQSAIQTAEETEKAICEFHDRHQEEILPAEESEKEMVVLHDERQQVVYETSEDSIVAVPETTQEEASERMLDIDMPTVDSEAKDLHPGEGVIDQINAFEEKIRQIQASELQLQLERNDLCSEVAGLKTLVEQIRNELEASNEKHSEQALRHNEEKDLLQKEAETTRVSLSTEVNQLQEVISEQSKQHESTLEELLTCQSKLENETESSQQLETRMKIVEFELQSERALHCESASKCMLLNQSLDETTQKLSAMEADLLVSKTDNELVRKALESAECQLLEITKEKHSLEETLQQQRALSQSQEQRINRLQQEWLSQRTGNAQLAKKVGELNSEVLILQQQLITCQTQASEMAMRNVILEDMVAAKKRKIKEGEETIIQQAEKIAKQEEKFFTLQAKLSALQNDFSALEAKLSETRTREQDVRAQVERLSLELNLAKQEVVSSEVRLQKVVKQVKEHHEEKINKHKHNEWFLSRKIEHLERSDAEKEQLQQELRRIRSGGL